MLNFLKVFEEDRELIDELLAVGEPVAVVEPVGEPVAVVEPVGEPVAVVEPVGEPVGEPVAVVDPVAVVGEPVAVVVDNARARAVESLAELQPDEGGLSPDAVVDRIDAFLRRPR